MTGRQASLRNRAPSRTRPAPADRPAPVDLPMVGDDQLVGVLQDCWRQISQLQARCWATMVEIGRREPPPAESNPWRELESWEWASNQIGAALTLSTRRADGEYQLARQLLLKLPLVWDALSTGAIDSAKARVFVRHLGELTDPQIARISARLLPQAPGWTTGQLAHRLLREVLAIDPGFARRRYRKAARQRGVWGYLAEDGTAVLSAHGLSPAEAAAAAARLEELAAAIRAAGHPRTQDQLRADLFLRLLDGRYTNLTRDQIIAAMLADTDTDTDTDTAGLGTAGLGTAGLGTAGLGTAGLGTAGLDTAGLGTGLGTARRAASGCATLAGGPE
jgi:hypothetical protein